MRNLQEKITEEKEVTLAEVKEILKKRNAEEEAELSYVQRITYDYVKKFSLYDLKDVLALKKELREKFDLAERQANEIVDLLNPPIRPEELDLIFDKSDTRFSAEKKQEILDVIQKYSSKYVKEIPEEIEEEES